VPVPEDRVRPLTPADAPLLAALHAACDAKELALSKVNIDDPYIVGYFDGEVLAGAGSLLIGEHDLYDIGVLTHPNYRKRGIGAALTASVWREIDARGGVAQYVTIAENHGSVGVARRCGFALFMTEEGWSFPTP
jgi:ribosomal protein S18 acetylase RimI-like enzyme